MFNAGSAIGKIGLDMSGFTAGMLQAEGLMAVFPTSVTSFMVNPLLGVIDVAQQAGAAIKSAIFDTVDRASEIGNLADRLGVDPAFIDSIGRASQTAGGDVNIFADALTDMLEKAGDARDGSESAVSGFRALGIELDELARLTPEQLFFRVADGAKQLDDVQVRIFNLNQVMGGAGRELAGFLGQGSEDIRALADQYARAGGVVDEELVGMANSARLTGDLITAAIDGIKVAVARPILSALGIDAENAREKIAVFSEDVRTTVEGLVANVVDVVTPLVPLGLAVGELIGVIIFGELNEGIGLLEAATPLLLVFAQIISGVVVPSLEVLLTILNTIQAPAKFVIDNLGKLGQFVAGGISSVFDQSGSGSGFEFRQANPGSTVGDVISGRAFEPTINVSVDSADSSNQIAAKLRPVIEQTYERMQREVTGNLAGQLGADRVRGGL